MKHGLKSFESALDAVSVEAVDDNIPVFLFVVDGNDGLRVAIRFDGAIQQLHLLRGDTVGVVVVCVDLFNGYPLDLMNGLI